MQTSEDLDLDSTLIRRGRSATTFADMVEFAQNVHEREFSILLRELPDLARLSDTKFNLATRVLRRRFLSEDGSRQMELRRLGASIAETATSSWVAGRIRSIFDVDGGA